MYDRVLRSPLLLAKIKQIRNAENLAEAIIQFSTRQQISLVIIIYPHFITRQSFLKINENHPI